MNSSHEDTLELAYPPKKELAFPESSLPLHHFHGNQPLQLGKEKT